LIKWLKNAGNTKMLNIQGLRIVSVQKKLILKRCFVQHVGLIINRQRCA